MIGLPPDFFDRPSLQVAPELLGRLVTCHGVTLRLTEVEAYAGQTDPGSHAFKGMTQRNGSMFGDPGGLYVYLSHGLHLCANVVCGPRRTPSAVLLRAGEVLDGIEIAQRRRTRSGVTSAPRERDLARGPGRLGQALDLALGLDGTRVYGADATVLVHGASETGEYEQGPRVGVSGPGGDGERYPWRFWLAGESSVSTYRQAKPRTRPGT